MGGLEKGGLEKGFGGNNSIPEGEVLGVSQVNSVNGDGSDVGVTVFQIAGEIKKLLIEDLDHLMTIILDGKDRDINNAQIVDAIKKHFKEEEVHLSREHINETTQELEDNGLPSNRVGLIKEELLEYYKLN